MMALQGGEVSVDASLIIKLVVREADSSQADALYEEWVDQGIQMIAPPFYEVEVDSILRKKVTIHNDISVEEAGEAFKELQKLPIRILSVPGQRQRAWELSSQLGLPNVYDATYLALVELRLCEFWTADERLYNHVKDTLAYVRWIGHLIS